MSVTVGDNSHRARPMTASELKPSAASANVLAIVAAHNEAERIAATLAALAEAFPGARVWVADDGSSDETPAIAETCGACVVRSERVIGKGGAVTLAVGEALRAVAQEAPAQMSRMGSRRGEDDLPSEPVVLLCDGDLGESARELGPLVGAVVAGDSDMAVASFAKRVGGGLGVAVGFAGWAIRRRCGLELRAPISGQRALRASVLVRALPFADGFGMEIGMTIDLARAGARVDELELDLSHRATGRTFGGFLHRGHQLVDFVRVYFARRR
jgi:glycosyltransferase involved in cell wall biosynthesis